MGCKVLRFLRYHEPSITDLQRKFMVYINCKLDHLIIVIFRQIHGMLSAVPWRCGTEGRQQRHRGHQEQEVRPVCGLVSNRFQGLKILDRDVQLEYILLCSIY